MHWSLNGVGIVEARARQARVLVGSDVVVFHPVATVHAGGGRQLGFSLWTVDDNKRRRQRGGMEIYCANGVVAVCFLLLTSITQHLKIRIHEIENAYNSDTQTVRSGKNPFLLR